MAQGTEAKTQNDWRKTWLVESLIAPLPVVGPFLKQPIIDMLFTILVSRLPC